MKPVIDLKSRREFLKETALVATALIGTKRVRAGASEPRPTPATQPWFRRTYRWGQTNITELDPTRFDIAWWHDHWKRTATEGVIINAGGIVAYYPSAVPLHRRAQFLNGRDLFGELCRAAHDAGLAVLARMDSNRAHAEFHQAHPDWFAVDAAGRPCQAGELFIACVNSPYYEEHIPGILREIIGRYHPEGFADNSWSGLGRDTICCCDHCRRRFRERTGRDLPREKDWNDAGYRAWILWNYERRLEIWDLNNRVTRAAGGPDCVWLGMNSGSVSAQCQSFREFRGICRRAPMLLLDHQARSDAAGFQQNGEVGKLVHELAGWDTLAPESMAMYQAGRPTFRLSSKPEPEARMWMIEGLAGGLQPWWHHVGAYGEDRRMYRTAEPLYHWHRAHQEFLVHRSPVATVGVVWSQRNLDFYGRDEPDLLVELPWRGLTQALIRGRIPYLPVHADDLDRDAGRFAALALPNLAAMSDDQVAAVRRFVARGGGVIATGQTSLFDEWGDPRPDFALADVFGAHRIHALDANHEAARRQQAAGTVHSYLRLAPELRAQRDGPHAADEPPVVGERHAVLRGFEDTDLLAFGGALEPLKLEAGAQVLMTFVPPFPIYPPETAWMREPKTDIPGLVLNTTSPGARSAFLSADLDRRFGRDHLPDHGNLLAALVRWAANGDVPLEVEGPGLVDCHVYRQPGRLVLHLVNLTSAATWRQPLDELIPIGPLWVRVRLPGDVRGRHMRLLVSGREVRAEVVRGWSRFEITSLLDHEVAVVT